MFTVISAWWAINVIGGGGVANDALVYWAGARNAVLGLNPWAAAHNGWSYAAVPPTLLVTLPAGLLPAPVFAVLWEGASVAAAVSIVRSLHLPPAWIGYPPLVFGVLLGNPIVVSTALVLRFRGVLGSLLRPHNAIPAVVARPMVLLPLTVVAIASIGLFPEWLRDLSRLTSRYASESGPSINGWASYLIAPAAASVILIARRDLWTAAWLAPMVLAPSAGWYSAIALMIVASPEVGAVGALPVPGASVLASALVASRVVLLNRSPSQDIAERERLARARSQTET